MTRKIGLLAISALVLSVSLCFAESKDVLSSLGLSFSADASVYSQYIWRGFLLDRDVVLQPGAYVSKSTAKFGTFKAGAWSSLDIEDRDNLKSNELDYIFDYTYIFKEWLSVSLGHTYYDFVGAHTNSREFYAGVALPKILLSPSLFVYRDYGDPKDGGGDGTYVVLNATHSFPFTVKGFAMSLDLSGHIGYNHQLFINGNGGDAAVKAALTIPFAKNVTLIPNVNYSVPFADLSDKNDGNQKNRFFGGATFLLSI